MSKVLAITETAKSLARASSGFGLCAGLYDGEEGLRGRLDVLILQGQLWAPVVESEKPTIPTRSVLFQAPAYLLASSNRISQRAATQRALCLAC